MLFRLLLIFTLLPLAELLVLVWVKEQTSWGVTIALVLATGLIGAALIKWQGLWTVNRIRLQIRQGELPAAAIVDGMLILVAGALLITPGLLTDAAGFLLLVPAVRTRIRQWLSRRIQARFMPRDETRRDEIIDVQVIRPPSTDDPSDAGPGDTSR
jgi:UPF0716 protein FxsA